MLCFGVFSLGGGGGGAVGYKIVMGQRNTVWVFLYVCSVRKFTVFKEQPVYHVGNKTLHHYHTLFVCIFSHCLFFPLLPRLLEVKLETEDSSAVVEVEEDLKTEPQQEISQEDQKEVSQYM